MATTADPTESDPGIFADGVADCLLGTVEYLDFETLGAYLALSRRCLRHVDSLPCWEGWRYRYMDSRVPGHVRWSSSSDPGMQTVTSGLRRARCTYHLGRAVRSYEERLFLEAEASLRAGLRELPGHEQFLCRLGDVLYGRAMEIRPEDDFDSAAEHSGSGSPEEEESQEDEEGGASSSCVAVREKKTALLKEKKMALLQEAEGLYRTAFAANPRNSYAVNGLALFTEEGAGKKQLLELAVELDGDNPYALANLASHLAGSDDLRAVKYLDHALEVNPRLFYARIFRCKALLRLGNLEGAIESAQEHLEWRPNDELVQRLLAQMKRQRTLMRRQMLLV